MKKLLFAGVVAALTLAASTVRAADTMNPDSTMNSDTKPMDTTMGLMGTVKDVDKTKNMVTIEVPLAPGASVMQAGRSVGLDKLKKGDDVRASFDPSTSTITLINIEPKGQTHPMNQ